MIHTSNGNFGLGSTITTGGSIITTSSATVGIDYFPDTTWEVAEFTELDDKLKSLLSTSYKEIRGNCICFHVYIDGKSVRPLEDVLMMINNDEQFNVKIGRCGYNIFINNVKFIKIKNLIESSAKEYIEVEFEYGDMDYDNTLKSDLEKRSEKVNLLKHKINKK